MAPRLDGRFLAWVAGLALWEDEEEEEEEEEEEDEEEEDEEDQEEGEDDAEVLKE